MANASNLVLTSVTKALTKSRQTANVSTSSTSFVDVPTFASIAANANQLCYYVITINQTTGSTGTCQLIGVTSNTVYDTVTNTSTTTVSYTNTVSITSTESIKWQYKTALGADVNNMTTGLATASQMAVGDYVVFPAAVNNDYAFSIKTLISALSIALVSSTENSASQTYCGFVGYNMQNNTAGVVTVTLGNSILVSELHYGSALVANSGIVISFTGSLLTVS